ncbi:cytoplasmic polyadenylation element-binding protein 2 isoform X1 [Hippoglossus stenolepis]|uniref:cytoplasmic polyadenylation element-binding protein 2 isoform X1 n=1 Tax=Hippoglossus stenolepis TaxID=195615 RepID=UPI00159C863A|nr:cytoplasmic polyadenylation element-binding protein 2 isoform X1 [Hippoglossus stenolepis]
MQDEPAGLTITQLPPSPEEKDRSTVSRSGNQPNRTDSQPSSFTPDYSHLNQESAFPDFDRGRFCSPRSIRDLQHRRKIHQHLSQQDEFSPAVSPPPPGLFSHLPQRQLFSAKNDPGAADPRGSPLEEAEADAASPSPTSVNPRTIQMDSPIAHHINNGNGSSSTGNMLSGGLGAAFPNLPSQEMQSANGGSSSPSLPGFGTPWSVQTSSSPPPAPNSINPIHPIHANAINQMPNADSDNSFYPGIPSSINPAFFQSYSPVSANPCAGINVPGYSGPFSPQINVHQQQSRRSPVSPQMHPQQGAFLQQRNNYNQHQPMVKQSPWGSHQGNGWGSGGMSWGRDHRRSSGMGVPGSVSHVSPLKKPFSSNVIAPPKFPRTGGSLGPKSWIEENLFRTDSNSNTLLPMQDRTRMYDSLNMHSLESSLIDIMRAEQDPMKGRVGCPHPGADGLLMLNARSYGRRRGRSSLFPIDDNLLDDGHGNQGVPGVLGSPSCYPHQNGERIERFSRKVFVGGLPPDIDEDEITSSFRRFGHLVVDWPHKAESKSYFPPKGYAFLLFQEESSVQALIEACMEEDGKLYLCVSSPTIKDKPVQIRPWNLSDSDFVMDGSQPLDPRKTIFVGGVPRPLRAIELAMIMDRLYGGVCYAGIDTDPELKYPKGAGRVAFSNQQSYIAAISARFVQLQHGDIDKRVEVKPYVLDDQLCDECQGARCGGKFAPFFCANVTCLQYYCEFCWANIHSRAGREFHKPLVKEGADRPRQIHFRWN